MSDFYIVPPRLIVGSLDRSNVVTSLNTLRGDLSFKVNPETGLTLNIASGIFTFSILPDFYVKKSGDTINSNIIFQPSSGKYGLAVGSGTSDPSVGIAGALFYNTNANVLKVYDGSTWNEIASTGTTGITVSFADNRYLRLDGSNTPTGTISMGSQFLRFANLTTRALAGTAGQVYFNTDTNKLDLYDGSSWVPVGSGITGLYAGAGASVSPNPITNTGTVSVNQAYNFNWTGTNTFTNPITFASNQQFDASKLTIAYEVAGDILTFSGTAWTRLAKGGANTLLGVHCCGGDLEYKTLVAGAGILISYQGSSIFFASTGGTGTGSGGSGGPGTGYTYYDKGDLLVGLGDSLYKLPVGPNKRFYLHSNSDTVSGVAWTTTVGMAITSIAPSSTVSYYGDLWYNTADGTLNVYYNDVDTSQWVEVVSGGAFSQVYQGVNYGIPFYVNSGSAITSNSNFTNVGTGVTLLYTTQSTSPSSGAFVVSGGVGIGASVFIGGAAQVQGITSVSALGWQSLVGSFGILSNDFRALVDDVTVGSLVNYGGFANVGNAFIGGTTNITNNTPAFSYDTGALVVYGGVGIGGTLFVSPNKASSVSGVKLSNGVVSQATWQGNTIQYNYGGTGYNSYNKGDILVGTGTSLLKLAVGTNNQVLAVDSSAATGLTWTNVATSGFATIGITSLNGISVGQQYLEATYTGINFGFTSSGSTHSLNIPIASSGTTGLVSTGTQTFSGAKTFSSNTLLSSSSDATNTSSGALVVTGGAGFGKSVFIGGNLDVAGDMYIRGTMTTINTVNLTVDDKNIEIGAVDTPSDITAEGGGITLKGSTDKTIVWNAGIGWSFNNPVNLSDGNTFKIGNTTVISSSSLGVGVTNSSLTSLGIITSGTWSATAITALYGGTGYSSYNKGDLLVGVGNTFIKLGVGTYNQALLADSSTPSGLKWGTVSGSGSGSGISIYITDIAPTTANSGDLWFNSESAILSVFYNDIDSNQWVEVGVNLAAIENIQNVGIGITKLNNLGSSSQYFTTGTTGSGFNITSTGSYHFFNIPIASTAATGLVSGLAQTFGGNKTFSNGLISSTGATIYGNLYLPDNPLASIYGGTGYSNYSLGDLVVGAGNSTIKLSKGPDRYVLQSNPAFASGLGWTNANGGVAVSTVPPINPFAGDLWWNSGDGSLSVYYNDVSGDNFWVEIEHGPGTGTVVVSGGTGGTGLTSLNGITDFAQYFQTGSSGVNFNISSVGSTHTFNIPNAGNGVTGLVTGTTQSFSGNKTFINNVVISSSTASTNLTTGALIVTGGVGIGGTLSSSVVSVNETFDILASNLTTSSTALNQVVHSVGATSYRTMKYTIQITSGSDYNAQEILLLHDGSTVYMTEYAQILAGSGLTLSTFDADINSGNVRLLVSPTNAVTTYKLSCTAMRV